MRRSVIACTAASAKRSAAGTGPPAREAEPATGTVASNVVGIDHLERDATGSYVCVLRRAGDLAALRASVAP